MTEPEATHPDKQLDWRDCCRAYVDDCLALIDEWALEVATQTDPSIAPEHYRKAIGDTLETLEAIGKGAPCPWHDKPEQGPRGWRNYLACIKMAGEPDFEKRLASSPIVVIPE